MIKIEKANFREGAGLKPQSLNMGESMVLWSQHQLGKT